MYQRFRRACTLKLRRIFYQTTRRQSENNVTFIFTAVRTSIPYETPYHSWHSQMLQAYVPNDRYRTMISIHLPQNCLPWPYFVKNQSPENRRTTSRDAPSPPYQVSRKRKNKRLIILHPSHSSKKKQFFPPHRSSCSFLFYTCHGTVLI